MGERLEADRAFCHRCDRTTDWTPVRGGKRLRCTGCRDVFPCRHACTHADCEEVRNPPEYRLDGETVDLDGFIEDNDLDEDEVDELRSLQPGQRFTLGGGAWAEVYVERVK